MNVSRFWHNTVFCLIVLVSFLISFPTWGKVKINVDCANLDAPYQSQISGKVYSVYKKNTLFVDDNDEELVDQSPNANLRLECYYQPHSTDFPLKFKLVQFVPSWFILEEEKNVRFIVTPLTDLHYKLYKSQKRSSQSQRLIFADKIMRQFFPAGKYKAEKMTSSELKTYKNSETFRGYYEQMRKLAFDFNNGDFSALNSIITDWIIGNRNATGIEKLVVSLNKDSRSFILKNGNFDKEIDGWKIQRNLPPEVAGQLLTLEQTEPRKFNAISKSLVIRTCSKSFICVKIKKYTKIINN